MQRVAQSSRELGTHVIRAQQLWAVAAGQSYTRAAESTGRKSGGAVSHLGAHFNREGLQAMTPRTGSGRNRSIA
jgi:hypothetical protein